MEGAHRAGSLVVGAIHPPMHLGLGPLSEPFVPEASLGVHVGSRLMELGITQSLLCSIMLPSEWELIAQLELEGWVDQALRCYAHTTSCLIAIRDRALEVERQARERRAILDARVQE